MCAACRQAVKEFVDLLVRDQSPLGARPLLPASSALAPGTGAGAPGFDAPVQRHLSHFSLVTHGFGAPAIVAAMSAVQNYLGELVKCVDRAAAADHRAPAAAAEFHFPAAAPRGLVDLPAPPH